MARSRNIKPAIMDNEQLAEFEPATRLLFIYLWMLADREGRLEDRPKRIAVQALPYDRDLNVESMLADLQSAGFIVRYEAAGVKVIQITAFNKHQTPHIREAASELPASTSQGQDEHQPRQVQGRDKIRDDTHLAESLRKKVMQRDGSRCLSCESEIDLHVDHIIPRALGGKTELENLQTLCRVCNQSKGAKNSLDFRKHNLGKAEHQPRSPDSLFSDSLIPDSLIPDSLTHTPSLVVDVGFVEKEIQQNSQSPPKTVNGHITWVMRKEGISDGNPSSPKLSALVEAGASVEEFRAAAASAVQKKKGFAYALAIVERARTEAKAMSTTLHRGPLPVAETTYQRSMRERMAEAAPDIAKPDPNILQFINQNVIEVPHELAHRVG